MADRFSSFIILAGMRTGSNFLEESLNLFPGLRCYGEVFNPHFVGHAKKTELFGLSLSEREANPVALIERMKSETDGIAGFRFFHDHDPRILKYCLNDKTCAKIILSRNPVDTYVSREIALLTNQWRLGDMRSAKSAKIQFSKVKFEKHLAGRQEFYLDVQQALQKRGQTGFYIDYEDISDPEILCGLAGFLGVNAEVKKPSGKTKKQNPSHMKDKVENYPEMVSALASIDYFALSGTPVFEPRRGPAVPSFVAAAFAPLIFMPIKSGPYENVIQWLSAFDENGENGLIEGFSQKTLRQWKRKSKGHQSFAVVRHPVKRLYKAFVKHILLPGPESYVQIHDTLVKNYGLPSSLETADGTPDVAAHREAFIRFTNFIKGNLNGQTSIRVDGAWASQAEVLRGMSNFMMPDHILRETDLESGLKYLASFVGRECPELPKTPDVSPVPLAELYNSDVEEAVRSAYQRDYMMFGFSSLKAQLV